MPSRRSSAVFLMLALFGASASGTVAGTLLERTVAFVNKKPILLSDAELSKTLLQIGLEDATERTIDEALMYNEASRLMSDTQAEAEVMSAVAVLREKAGSGFTAAALRRKAITQLAIARYIDLRLRPLVRVEDAAVRQVFNEKVANDPLAPGFSQLADSIRESLERRSLDQKIEEWVASLRRRESVRRPPTPAR